MKPASLGQRLFLSVLLPALALVSGLCALVYFRAREIGDISYDYNLEITARTLALKVSELNGEIHIDFPVEVIPLLRRLHVDSRFYQIVDARGAIVAGLADLPEPPPGGDDIQLYSRRYHETELRIAAVSIPLADKVRHARVLVAETLNGRELLAQKALREIGEIAALFLVVLVVVGFLGIRYALGVIDPLRVAMERRSVKDLSMIEDRFIPAEVRPLVLALNGLLARLAEELHRQRRFISNAAHQLRTPIAGLRTQIELAMRDIEPGKSQMTLGNLQQGIDRIGRAVSQLLTLAAAERSLETQQLVPIDLCTVAAEAARDLVPQALSKEIDLGFDGVESGALVLGDPASLRELCSNLFENGVRYTPTGGTVTARIVVDQEVHLFVEDTGPGIPMSERTRVFERFYRIPGSPVGGSGLGLAIVKEIADSHRARIKINDRGSLGGTAIEVIFPRVNSAGAL